MTKLTKIGILLIMLTMICIPVSEADTTDKIDLIVDETVIMRVPTWKKHLIQQRVDVDYSIAKARCYFNKSEGDRWIKAMWDVESSQAEPDVIIIGDGGASYGPFQIQIPTVRLIDDAYNDIDLTKFSDVDIAYMLLFNFDFSVEMAARYLGHLESRFQVWSSAVEAYNRGAGGVKAGKRLGLPYYSKILRAYKKETGVSADPKLCKEITTNI